MGRITTHRAPGKQAERPSLVLGRGAVCLTTDLPAILGVLAILGERSAKAVRCVLAVALLVLDCVKDGILLGLIGACLVACAIPILLCIPSLHP